MNLKFILSIHHTSHKSSQIYIYYNIFQLLSNAKNYSELISMNNCIFQLQNDKLAQNQEKDSTPSLINHKHHDRME